MANPSDFTGNQYWQPKPRQAVKVDPTDNAHLTTHQPPEEYQDSGNQTLDYAHKPATDMMRDRGQQGNRGN